MQTLEEASTNVPAAPSAEQESSTARLTSLYLAIPTTKEVPGNACVAVKPSNSTRPSYSYCTLTLPITHISTHTHTHAHLELSWEPAAMKWRPAIEAPAESSLLKDNEVK